MRACGRSQLCSPWQLPAVDVGHSRGPPWGPGPLSMHWWQCSSSGLDTALCEQPPCFLPSWNVHRSCITVTSPASFNIAKDLICSGEHWERPLCIIYTCCTMFQPSCATQLPGNLPEWPWPCPGIFPTLHTTDYLTFLDKPGYKMSSLCAGPWLASNLTSPAESQSSVKALAIFSVLNSSAQQEGSCCGYNLSPSLLEDEFPTCTSPTWCHH